MAEKKRKPVRKKSSEKERGKTAPKRKQSRKKATAKKNALKIGDGPFFTVHEMLKSLAVEEEEIKAVAVGEVYDSLRLNPRQIEFMMAFSRCGNISKSCRSINVSRIDHYYWMENHEYYREAFKKAQLQAAELLENEARRRAVEGLRRIRVHSKTGEVFVEHEYSDTLMSLLLKANLPDKFGHIGNVNLKADHTHKGHDGGPVKAEVQVDWKKAPPDLQLKMLEFMEEQERIAAGAASVVAAVPAITEQLTEEQTDASQAIGE